MSHPGSCNNLDGCIVINTDTGSQSVFFVTSTKLGKKEEKEEEEEKWKNTKLE